MYFIANCLLNTAYLFLPHKEETNGVFIGISLKYRDEIVATIERIPRIPTPRRERSSSESVCATPINYPIQLAKLLVITPYSNIFFIYNFQILKSVLYYA